MSHRSFARVRALGLRLPGVEEGTSYGTPALKVRSKFLARMKEDGETLVIKCADLDEKEFLLLSAPAIFFETDHYKGWTSVLVRLDQITETQLFALIEQSWRREAGRKLVESYDQNASSTAAAPKPRRSRAKAATKPTSST